MTKINSKKYLSTLVLQLSSSLDFSSWRPPPPYRHTEGIHLWDGRPDLLITSLSDCGLWLARIRSALVTPHLCFSSRGQPLISAPSLRQHWALLNKIFSPFLPVSLFWSPLVRSINPDVIFCSWSLISWFSSERRVFCIKYWLLGRFFFYTSVSQHYQDQYLLQMINRLFFWTQVQEACRQSCLD